MNKVSFTAVVVLGTLLAGCHPARPPAALSTAAETSLVTERTYLADEFPRSAAAAEAPDWLVSNFEYPAGSLRLETLAEGRPVLRIGDPAGGEPGRYTISLRYPWSAEPGFLHEVSVRLAADYGGQFNSGAGFIVTGPGRACHIGLANGKCTLGQPWLGRETVPNLTDDIRAVLGGSWHAAELHTYTLRWQTTTAADAQFDFAVDGQPVKTLPGEARDPQTVPGLHLSFEYGRGTVLIESVRWKTTPSAEVLRRLRDERGRWCLVIRGQASGINGLNAVLGRWPAGRHTALDLAWSPAGYRLSAYPGEYALALYGGFLIAGTPYEAIGTRLTALLERGVRDGATLVVLGGPLAFGRGRYQASPLEQLLPVRAVGPFEVKAFARPEPLRATRHGRKLLPPTWRNSPPTVHGYHALPLTPGAQVLWTAGGQPMLVRRKLGRGDAYVFLGYSAGPEASGYWSQADWPRFLATLMKAREVQ